MNIEKFQFFTGFLFGLSDSDPISPCEYVSYISEYRNIVATSKLNIEKNNLDQLTEVLLQKVLEIPQNLRPLTFYRQVVERVLRLCTREALSHTNSDIDLFHYTLSILAKEYNDVDFIMTVAENIVVEMVYDMEVLQCQ